MRSKTTVKCGDGVLELAVGSIPNDDKLRFLHCQKKAFFIVKIVSNFRFSSSGGELSIFLNCEKYFLSTNLWTFRWNYHKTFQ